MKLHQLERQRPARLPDPWLCRELCGSGCRYLSVQETKMQPGQADFAPDGYTEYTYSAEKKGYSGTACWCREQPLSVTTGIGIEQHDHEGRVLTLEYPGFWLVNCYTPTVRTG